MERYDARFHEADFSPFLFMHAKLVKLLPLPPKVFSFLHLIHNNISIRPIIFKSDPLYIFDSRALSFNVF
jgi:hypothetical protein